jgi:hypothetical protein
MKCRLQYRHVHNLLKLSERTKFEKGWRRKKRKKKGKKAKSG